jgi:hypothetical protein
MTRPNVWVGTQPNPDDCLKLTVSAADRAAVSSTFGQLGATVTVTDIPTGKWYILRRAKCGLPTCNCALELVKEL